MAGPAKTPSTESAGGRNLAAAIVTGLALAGILLGLLYTGPLPFFILAFVVIIVAQAEFYSAARRSGYRPATALGLAAGAVMLVGSFTEGEGAAGLVIFLTLFFSIIWYLAFEPKRGLVAELSVTMLGVLYIPLLGSFAALLARDRPPGVVVAMIGAAAVYDVFAYAGGATLGRRPIAPAISPRKTIEGAGIATVAMLIIGPPIATLLGPWSYLQGLAFIAMTCVAAPVGDLVESLIKRDLGIKDTGMIFPGHGGALDRIDAILFTAPVTYLSLRLFGL